MRLAFTGMVDEGPIAGRPLWDRHFRFKVFVAMADGSDLQQVSAEHGEDHAGYPVWSPDGSSLTYEVGSRDYTRRARYRAFVDGTAPVQLPANADPPERALGPEPADVSPDRHLVAVPNLGDGYPYGLSITTIDGHLLATYATTYKFVRELAWAPDGNAIAFIATDETAVTAADEDDEMITPASLHVLERATGKIWRVCRMGFNDIVRWSPDGQRFAVIRDSENGGDAVYLVNRDGTGLRHVLDLNMGDASGEIRPVPPAWSADGRYLAISTLVEEEDFEIDIYTAGGTFVCRLLWPEAALARIDDLAWQPLPSPH